MHRPQIVSFILIIFGFAITTTPCARAADAAANYKDKCTVCHADDGSGKTAAAKKMDIPDLRSKPIRSMSDADLYETIAKGAKHKQYPHSFLYKGLTEAEIQDLVRYLRALK